jgi:methionyl-tRNA synthetase
VAAAPARAEVSFEEFQRLDLRVAEIVAAEPIPKAKRLLRLELDIGDARRQVVAGIAERYAPDQLLGKKVIFLANLKPATIRGVKSEGMVLAAGGDAVLGLSTVEPDLPAGTVVR